ncbi:MAG TPA: Uma2 family endonuclease [Methylomirabilota bacterium]|nr:Uma2 family endonuclease [Methylomirabilota bacterium]
MSLLEETPSFTEPITEPDILASIASLPTEDDLPCDDGEPMETARHREQMEVLIQSLQVYWAERRNYYVGGNMFLHYDPRNRKKFRGPDFFLVLDVDNRERKSWVVWQEGMRFPDVIIELLSDSTREVDKGEKKTLYERVFHTGEYYLYDPFSQEFIGYHLHGPHPHYIEVQPDATGKIFSPTVGLYLVVRNGWLRWMTPEGAIVPSPMELAEQEHQRAEQEHQRAEQEHQRAERLEQLLTEYQQRFGKLE